jgi:hypothetical protein
MSPRRARRRRCLDPLDVAPLLRDEVDHGEERITAVEGGAGAPDDFDPLDQIEIDAGFFTDVGLVIHVVVRALPVQQEQNPRVVIPGALETPNADIRVIAVTGDIEARKRLEDVAERAVSVRLDLRRRHDAHERRDVPRALRALRRGDDDFQIHELLEVERQEIGRSRWLGRLGLGRDPVGAEARDGKREDTAAQKGTRAGGALD